MIITNKQVWFFWIKKYPISFFMIVLCIFIVAPSSLLITVFLGYAINALQNPLQLLKWSDFIAEHPSRWITSLVRNTPYELGISVDIQRSYFPLFLLVIASCSVFFRGLQEYLQENIGEKIARHLRFAVVNKFLGQNYSEAVNTDEGMLSAMIANDAHEVHQTFARLLGVGIDLVIAFLFIIWLIILDTQFFLLFIMILIPAGIIIKITGKMLKQYAKRGLNWQSVMLSSMLEKLRGWQNIKIYNSLNFEMNKFAQLNNDLYNNSRREVRIKALSSPLIEWLAIITISLILAVAVKRIAENSLPTTVLTSFIFSVIYLGNCLQNVAIQYTITRRGTESFHRICEYVGLNTNIFNEKINIFNENTNTFNVLTLFGSNVGLQKNNKNLFNNLNFSISKGEWLIITGPSGSGKSSLLKLIAGIEQPDTGYISITDDDKIINTNSENFKMYRQKIGFIAQEPFIFNGTILENISYPFSLIDSELNNANNIINAEKALTMSCLNKITLSSDVSCLSGGEKQRLAFARLFFHRPDLILIDEATSALDLINEEQILNNLKKYLPNSIVILVAHRQSIKTFASKELQI